MAIILEGFDNSGKSTLANYLSEKLKMPIYHPGGPPKDDEAAFKCLLEQQQLASKPVIIDRVTSISRQCYEPDTLNSHELCVALDKLLSSKRVILVYCRPPNSVLHDWKGHETKDYDSTDHIEFIMDQADSIINNYDKLMTQFAHISYDWTQDADSLDWLSDRLLLTQHITGYNKILLDELALTFNKTKASA
jgi:hypothetical protein